MRNIVLITTILYVRGVGWVQRPNVHIGSHHNQLANSVAILAQALFVQAVQMMSAILQEHFIILETALLGAVVVAIVCIVVCRCSCCRPQHADEGKRTDGVQAWSPIKLPSGDVVAIPSRRRRWRT